MVFKYVPSFQYALGRIPPHSKYDRLVITVEMARQIFEERQHVYDLKAHEVITVNNQALVQRYLHFLNFS